MPDLKLQLAPTQQQFQYTHPRTCSECNGRGAKTTAIWVQFRRQPFEEQRRLFDNAQELRKWFADRNELQPINENTTLTSLPCENVTCPQCSGTGLFPAE